MQRKIAYEILCNVLLKNEYANLAMQKELKVLPLQQRPFVTELVNAVLRRYLFLRKQVSLYVQKDTKEDTFILLSMAFYERFYRKEKDYAVCNEYVSLCSNSGQKSFVNAVLRNVSSFRKLDLEGVDADSVNYSIPEWILRLWKAQFSEEDYRFLLEDSQSVPCVTYRMNPHKTSREELMREGAEFFSDLGFSSSKNMLQNPLFKEGAYYVQDRNAMDLVDLLELNEDSRFLDMCSAPGSKFFNALETVKEENAFSNDLFEHRSELIEKTGHRLGYHRFHIHNGDARLLNSDELGRFDRVLLDAPCSGLGILKRKPDLRYHIKPNDLDDLQVLQKELLESAYALLKEEGILVYSTCTLNKKENDKQVYHFILNHPDMILLEEKTYLHEPGDHFYAAKMRKERAF